MIIKVCKSTFNTELIDRKIGDGKACLGILSWWWWRWLWCCVWRSQFASDKELHHHRHHIQMIRLSDIDKLKIQDSGNQSDLGEIKRFIY